MQGWGHAQCCKVLHSFGLPYAQIVHSLGVAFPCTPLTAHVAYLCTPPTAHVAFLCTTHSTCCIPRHTTYSTMHTTHNTCCIPRHTTHSTCYMSACCILPMHTIHSTMLHSYEHNPAHVAFPCTSSAARHVAFPCCSTCCIPMHTITYQSSILCVTHLEIQYNTQLSHSPHPHHNNNQKVHGSPNNCNTTSTLSFQHITCYVLTFDARERERNKSFTTSDSMKQFSFLVRSRFKDSIRHSWYWNTH